MKRLLLLSVLYPFVSVPSFFPTVMGENFFIRGCVVLVSMLFSIYVLYSEKERDLIIQKIQESIKNPLVISVCVFVCLSAISTIFAVDTYSAFWGTIERLGGFAGLFYFFCLFVFIFLIFEREDWFLFFKAHIVVSTIVFSREIIELLGGLTRPSSFLGNPTLLAGYFLFSLFCALAVLSETENKFWKYFTLMTCVLSVVGIFMTQTRGTLVGLVVAGVSVLGYILIRGKGVTYRGVNLREFAGIMLCIVFVFSLIFISTRKNDIWQKVPGLSRIALISGEDATTQTRLIVSKLSLQAVNPLNEGIKKLLIGWGPENFSLAYATYFNPKQFDYKVEWFDRSHNKLLDVLVMTGLLGLLAYLSIFFFFFRSIFRNREFSLLQGALLFFGVSLFVHLLFIFDDVAVSVSLYAILAFSLFLQMNENGSVLKDAKKIRIPKIHIFSLYIFFSIVSLFLLFLFLRSDLQIYFQMKKYHALRQKSNVFLLNRDIPKVFQPFTIAQKNIRYDFLSFVSQNYDKDNPSIVTLFTLALTNSEAYIIKNPQDIQFLNLLGLVYIDQGNLLREPEYFEKSKNIFSDLSQKAPHRIDVKYGLALSLFNQKKYDESFLLFEQIFMVSPQYFAVKQIDVQGNYTQFIKHFYEVKDISNFIKTTDRLKQNNYVDSKALESIVDYVQKKHTWPYINFK